MSKKRFLISALAIAACGAGALTLPATPAWADADEDNSLAPVVMIVFDTSGSMDYCFETSIDGKAPHDADGNELEIYCNQFKTHQKKTDYTETRDGYVGIMSSVYAEGDPDISHSKIVLTNEDGDETNEFYYTNDTCEGAWNAPWIGCHTEPILGYKGIREECVHTRLTKAIAEIAGTPKTIDGRNRLVKANEQKPVRVSYSGGTYHYSEAEDPRYIKNQYLYDCTDHSSELCDSDSLDYGHHCYENDYYYCVSAVQTFGDKDDNDLSDYYHSVGNYYDHNSYYNNYLKNHFGNINQFYERLADAYNDDGIIQSYAARVKFGFAGFDYTANEEFLYNNTASDEYKSVNKMGISNDKAQSQAPLLYPTAYNDPEKIIERNNAVAYSVRGYWAGGGTPIGPALADIGHVLTADPKRMTEGSVHDDSYSCREKAVILITDGAPSSLYGVKTPGAKGQGARVWEDAYRLFKNHKIKVYVVGYSLRGLNPRRQPAETTEITKIVDGEEVTELVTLENGCADNPSVCYGDITASRYDFYDDPSSLDNFAGDILNRIAWKGGTCVNPVSGDLLDPDDETAYRQMLAQCDAPDSPNYSDNLWKCRCFFDAESGDKLRAALVSVLSDMTSGFYSKTKVVTTTAIGYKHKHNHTGSIATGDYQVLAGFYNVYSGYSIGKGAMTTSKLERTAIVCDPNTGEFYPDEDQKMDMAEKLNDRLKNCAERVDRIDAFGSNTCTDKRLIFSGKYSTFYLYPPISKFERGTDVAPNNVKVDNIEKSYPKKTSNENSVGILPRVVIGDKEFGDIFGLVNHKIEDGAVSACSDLMHYGYNEDQYVKADFEEVNYILSPYECVTNVDCGMDGKHSKQCDIGRCIPYKNYDSYKNDNGCDRNGEAYNSLKQYLGKVEDYPLSASYICVNGLLRPYGTERCNAHHCGKNAPSGCRGCEEGKVCHAGACVAGAPTSGSDVKQFVASQPLGPIEFATPVVVPPPNRVFNSEDYIKFVANYMTRDTMLLVGANDAMLHAFILGDNIQSDQYEGCSPNCNKPIYNLPFAMKDVANFPEQLEFDADKKEGDELWAFVPKLMLRQLGTLVNKFSTTDKVAFNGVNSTPVYADVHLPSGLTINGDYWRTVVVGGLGGGGRGYYALDVTDPGNPFVLWEVDNDPELSSTSNFVSYIACEALGWAGSYCDSRGTHMLGYSYPEPVITNMVIKKDGVSVVEPVVILAAGRDDDNKFVYEEHGSAKSKPGYAMYILRLFPRNNDDLFVRSFYFNEKLTGTPAVFPNGFNSTAQRIYVGGEKGSLYAINVTGDVEKWGADETETAINMLKPYGKVVPKPIFRVTNTNIGKITFAPAVSLYSTYLSEPVIQLAFGTGRSDQITTSSSDLNYVASFLDVPQGLGSKVKYKLNALPSGASGTLQSVLHFRPTLYTFGGSVNIDKNTPAPIAASKNFTDLEHMTAAPITYNFTSYFATYVTAESTGSQCLSGHANIYRFNSVDNSMFLEKLTDNLQNYGDTDDRFVTEGEAIPGGSGNRILLSSGQIYGLDVSEQLYCRINNSSNPYARGKTWLPQLMFLSNSKETADEAKFVKTHDETSTKASGINLDAIKSDVTFSTWASVYE